MTAETSLAARAHELARDLLVPDPRVYWSDLMLTTLALYVSLGLAITSRAPGLALLAGAVCVLALYRAISFIHELTHLRADAMPGFHLAWNVLVGVPFLTPSLLYEGVHILHHARDRYGTARDPEYHPLARLPPHHTALFLGAAALAPVGVVLRFAVLTPLSFLWPPLRRQVLGRLSAMTINPRFTREDLAFPLAWRAQEIACWLWSWTLAALALSGGLATRAVLTGAAVMAVATFVNQLRTLVAHAWESDGAPMSLAEQFRDSINVPPPGWLPLLWAPVGLRYHALHHLAPRVPYHNLAEAHRRLCRELDEASVYHESTHRHLSMLIARLAKSTMGKRAKA